MAHRPRTAHPSPAAPLAGSIALFALINSAQAASAHIVSVTGDLTIIEPPPNVYALGGNDLEMDIFLERANQTLPSPLSVDITQPGLVDDDSELSIGVIPAGTRIASYLVNVDTPQGQYAQQGSVTFDTQILGIIVRNAPLDQTDVTLGYPGTLYPSTGSKRHWELGQDSVTLSADRRTVSMTSVNVDGVDHMRIIVQDPQLQGDFDGDGDVDGVDLAIIFTNFNGPGGGTPLTPATDLDGDGDVDGVDLAAVFGQFTGPLTPTNVPEPASLFLFGTATFSLVRRR